MTDCYRDDAGWWLKGRHLEHPADWTGNCPSCQPCPANHCGECRAGVHLGFGENTCPECIGRVRAKLRLIVELAATLPDEAEVRGVHSEAANLNGPFADPEAFAWRRAAKAGRADVLISELAAADPLWEDDEHHPAAVLKRFVQALEEDYGDPYDRGDDLASITDWIDARLHRIANDYNQDFGQFKHEVEKVVGHMEAVLHAGEQRDTGAPCLTCHTRLTKTWGLDEKHDGWECKRCHTTSTHAQYLFVVAAEHRAKAEWLTAEAMETRTAESKVVDVVRAGTVRVWATRGQVKKRQDSGQVLYSVADVEAKAPRKEVAS